MIVFNFSDRFDHFDHLFTAYILLSWWVMMIMMMIVMMMME